jgi:hypothetical protein
MKYKVVLLTFFLCLASSWSSLSAAEIYKVVNADGSVSYSDQPPLDGPVDEVTLPDLFIMPSVVVPTVSAQSSTSNTQSKSVRIHAPLDEEVIRGSDNRLSINVSVSPQIAEDEKLQLYQNDKPYGPAQSSSQWNLARLIPGVHKFYVQLIDANGQKRATSSTVTVYVIL